MVGFLSRDDWSISYQREVNPGVGHQVGLELSEIDIQGTIESKRGSDGRHDLSNQPENDVYSIKLYRQPPRYHSSLKGKGSLLHCHVSYTPSSLLKICSLL